MKTIYISESAPGSGKTEALLDATLDYTLRGQRVVLALPTLALAAELESRAAIKGIRATSVNSKTAKGVSVRASLEAILKNKNHELVIATHEGIRRCTPGFLAGYILVFDETPAPLVMQHHSFCKNERNDIDKLIEVKNETLTLRPGKSEEMRQRVNVKRAGMKGATESSGISNQVLDIFECILEGHWVTAKTRNDNLEITTIRILNLRQHINLANEFHVLSAVITESLFSVIYKKWGYILKPSLISAEKEFRYRKEIFIYPILDKPNRFSKSLALIDSFGFRHTKHLGAGTSLPAHQNFDVMLQGVLAHSGPSPRLLFSNTWARPGYIDEDTKLCPIDCRGLDELNTYDVAILMFGGKPSPRDKEALKFLSTQLKIKDSILISAWIHTNNQAASLQAVTRTSLRDRNSTRSVRLYVQDHEVADYLKSSYMHDAVIDYSFAESLYLYSAETESKNIRRARKESVEHLLNIGRSLSDIYDDITTQYSVHEITVRRDIREIQRRQATTL